MSPLMRTPFAETPPPKGVPGKWQPKFVEEFNHGLGPKFASGWPPSAAVTPPMGASEVACYDPACVTVENSVCTLSVVNKTQVVAGVTFEYATGLISTPAQVFALGDFVEWRANFDGHNHAGLWTSAPDWPSGGEYDVVEWLDGQPTSNYHGPEGALNSGPIAGKWTGWHTFGAHYGPAENYSVCATYFDGKMVANPGAQGVTASQWLIASVMLDQWGGPLVVPSKLRIDYVRIWEPS